VQRDPLPKMVGVTAVRRLFDQQIALTLATFTRAVSADGIQMVNHFLNVDLPGLQLSKKGPRGATGLTQGAVVPGGAAAGTLPLSGGGNVAGTKQAGPAGASVQGIGASTRGGTEICGRHLKVLFGLSTSKCTSPCDRHHVKNFKVLKRSHLVQRITDSPSITKQLQRELVEFIEQNSWRFRE
jgi:hypothetical protein